MGTDELAMGWIKDEIGRAVGLPREIGGTPAEAQKPQTKIEVKST